jgi:uncharacterized protein (DUF433 family)
MLQETNMNWQDYIEERPGVMLGKPVFRGTRITVEHVLRELGGGTREADLLAAHPHLTDEHLRAALLYAAALIDLESTVAT